MKLRHALQFLVQFDFIRFDWRESASQFVESAALDIFISLHVFLEETGLQETSTKMAEILRNFSTVSEKY